MARYHCQNCDARFELSAGEALRCPSCFWTSSVQALDPGDEAAAEVTKKPKPDSQRKKASVLGKTSRLWFRLLLFSLLLAALLILIFEWPALFARPRVFSGKSIAPPTAGKSESNQTVRAPAPDLAVLLSKEEEKTLARKIPFSVPRELPADELATLTRRVNFSSESPVLPALVFWTLEKFEDELQAQQRRRKIQFPWSYEHSLTRLFKEHYLKADALVREGQYEMARLELLNALLFPVYANNLRLHRAVALVMLQNFINDTLGKIKTLNAYLLKQSVEQELADLREDYGHFFSLIDKEDWDSAFQFVERLEEKAKTLEQKLKTLDVGYPPVLGQIDEDIQKGLLAHDESLLALSRGLNSVLADLRIKKATLKQNTAASLEAAKSAYEAACAAIEAKQYAEAKTLFENGSYPPEIDADAKQKIAILSRLLSSRAR